MSLKKLFGNNIAPDCEYCRYYIKKAGSNPVCRYGAMSFEQTCRRYVYDPLKREPRNLPDIPKYTADDFKL